MGHRTILPCCFASELLARPSRSRSPSRLRVARSADCRRTPASASLTGDWPTPPIEPNDAPPRILAMRIFHRSTSGAANVGRSLRHRHERRKPRSAHEPVLDQRAANVPTAALRFSARRARHAADLRSRLSAARDRPQQRRRGRRRRSSVSKFDDRSALRNQRPALLTITLERPERKNPLTFELYAELRDRFRRLGDERRNQGRRADRRRRELLLGRRRARDHRTVDQTHADGTAGVHADDRRPGEGDARLPAADRRGDRRHLRRRGRDPRDGQRSALRDGAFERGVPVRASRAGGLRHGRVRDAAAHHRPTDALRAALHRAHHAAARKRSEWGFYNELCAPDEPAGTRASGGARHRCTARRSRTR